MAYFYWIAPIFVALACGLLARYWRQIINQFFTLRAKWRSNTRRSCIRQAHIIEFDKLRANIAFCRTDDGHYMNITNLYNCLIDQDMLSMTRLNISIYNLQTIYVQFAAPYSHISQEITCSTGAVKVNFGEKVVASYQI